MTNICYKTNTPVVYNKGTVYEKSCDTFLAYMTYKSIEEAQTEVDKINTEKPDKLFNGEAAKCDERTYFVETPEANCATCHYFGKCKNDRKKCTNWIPA